MNIYLQGLTMGLAYVAPIGLQNLFVINSALTQKRSRVYLTALIVIFWDISLGVACFLGAGALMQALPWLQKVILAAGSLIAQEAGARVTTFAGTPVDPMQPGSMFCTNQVCADLLGRITV